MAPNHIHADGTKLNLTNTASINNPILIRILYKVVRVLTVIIITIIKGIHPRYLTCRISTDVISVKLRGFQCHWGGKQKVVNA